MNCVGLADLSCLFHISRQASTLFLGVTESGREIYGICWGMFSSQFCEGRVRRNIEPIVMKTSTNPMRNSRDETSSELF